SGGSSPSASAGTGGSGSASSGSASSGSASSAGSGSGGSASAPGTGPVTVDVGGFTGTFDPPSTDCRPGQYSDSNPLKAAWIYVGSPSDAGWTQAHDVGRKAAAEHFGKSLQTITKENVPEGP